MKPHPMNLINGEPNLHHVLTQLPTKVVTFPSDGSKYYCYYYGEKINITIDTYNNISIIYRNYKGELWNQH